MLSELLWTLFALDHPFIDLRLDGLSPERRASIAAFWKESDLADAAADLRLVPDDLDALNATLVDLARGAGGAMRYPYRSWLDAARRSEGLAGRDPVAASLVALEALAAWIGALGDHLSYQPFEGHHPGWHLFPLYLARNLAEADAIWGARHIVAAASGFIEAARDAFFNESIQSVLAEYQAVSERVERRYDECISELAWDLRAACAPSGPNFRAEVAAIFWASGDVLHAELMAAGNASDYVPSLPVLRTLVDRSLRRIADSPLQQYIWLEMRDRPPFDLRAHRVLFSSINNVFAKNAVHMIEARGVFSPSRAFARAAIGHFGGSIGPDERADLDIAFSLDGELMKKQAPVAYICMASLVNLVLIDEPAVQSANWRALASMAATLLQRADQFGHFELFDRSLDIPFCYLPVATAGDLRESLDRIEHYRCGNLWYWLMITPPPPPADERARPLLGEEEEALRELRGARFIRLLPRLPAHYRRHGFNVAEALDQPPPEGVAGAPREGSLLTFDPFDQKLAIEELRGTIERLAELHGKLRKVVPEYADARLDPCASMDEFIAALGPHESRRS